MFSSRWQTVSGSVKAAVGEVIVATRCSDSVLFEVIEMLDRGVKRAAPQADVIAWTWSWSIVEKDPQEELIQRLPRDVIVMSAFERGGTKLVCGNRATNYTCPKTMTVGGDLGVRRPVVSDS